MTYSHLFDCERMTSGAAFGRDFCPKPIIIFLPLGCRISPGFNNNANMMNSTTPKNQGVAMRKVSELDQSNATAATDECSFEDSASYLHDSFAGNQPRKSVRFSDNDSTDDVTCELHLVERFDGPDIWWRKEEFRAIRAECLDAVEGNEDSPISSTTLQFLSRRWKEGAHSAQPLFDAMRRHTSARGLEQYIVEDSSKLIADHVNDIIKESSTGVDERILSVSAARSSRPWIQLALLRAKFDEEEANRPELSALGALEFYA